MVVLVDYSVRERALESTDALNFLCIIRQIKSYFLFYFFTPKVVPNDDVPIQRNSFDHWLDRHCELHLSVSQVEKPEKEKESRITVRALFPLPRSLMSFSIRFSFL